MDKGDRKEKRILGMVLVVIGLMALVTRAAAVDLGPLFPLGLGVVFLLVFWLGGQEWAIFPGAFLTTVGAAVGLAASGRFDMSAWWPVFILAPGAAFLIIGSSARDHRWALVPGSIVSAVALFFFATTSGVISWAWFAWLGRWWPALLIALGVFIVLRQGGT
ncbi:MAG: hypothetical protein AB1445_14460 [Bacillota bacterium]